MLSKYKPQSLRWSTRPNVIWLPSLSDPVSYFSAIPFWPHGPAIMPGPCQISFLPQGLCTAAWDTLSLDSHGSLPHSLEVFAQMLPSQWDLPGFLHLNCSAHLTPGLLSHLPWLYPFCSMETLLKYCTIYVFIILFNLLFVSPLEYERTEIFFPSFVHWCAYGRCSRFQGSLKEHLPVHFLSKCEFHVLYFRLVWKLR